jgi:hypothetical protein
MMLVEVFIKIYTNINISVHWVTISGKYPDSPVASRLYNFLYGKGTIFTIKQMI